MTNEKMLDECRAHWEKTRPDAVFADYWIGWQASRESLVIELPQRWSVDGFESGWVADPDGANLDYAETVKAIEAAGLKVKP